VAFSELAASAVSSGCAVCVNGATSFLIPSVYGLAPPNSKLDASPPLLWGTLVALRAPSVPITANASLSNSKTTYTENVTAPTQWPNCCSKLLPEGTCLARSSSAAGHHCGRKPSYPTVIHELKRQRALGRRCYCRVVPYLNNIVEQDHRAIKRRVNACLGFRSFDGAQRTIQGYEAMHMIRKGQVRWLAKGNITEQVRFINVTFGLAA